MIRADLTYDRVSPLARTNWISRELGRWLRSLHRQNRRISCCRREFTKSGVCSSSNAFVAMVESTNFWDFHDRRELPMNSSCPKTLACPETLLFNIAESLRICPPNASNWVASKSTVFGQNCKRTSFWSEILERLGFHWAFCQIWKSNGNNSVCVELFMRAWDSLAGSLTLSARTTDWMACLEFEALLPTRFRLGSRLIVSQSRSKIINSHRFFR